MRSFRYTGHYYRRLVKKVRFYYGKLLKLVGELDLISPHPALSIKRELVIITVIKLIE